MASSATYTHTAGHVSHHVTLNPANRTYPSDPFEESVYSLIPIEYRPQPKPPRYRSIYANQARDEYQRSQVKKGASMGPPKFDDSINDKKREKYSQEKARKEALAQEREYLSSSPEKLNRKPAVPRRDERLDIKERQPKNYVAENTMKASQASPLRFNNPVAYVDKKDYGQTPHYLLKRKDELAQEAEQQRYQTQYDHERRQREAGLILLPEMERESILSGLQVNWEKLNKDYQKLSLTVDTVPKITRKVNLEKELKRLEQDIDKFSHPNIYVAIDTRVS